MRGRADSAPSSRASRPKLTIALCRNAATERRWLTFFYTSIDTHGSLDVDMPGHFIGRPTFALDRELLNTQWSGCNGYLKTRVWRSDL